jgi:hypothetical protein
MNVYFPLKKDASLRGQYQLLNLNSLRIGRIMSIVDALASDACTNYLRDHTMASKDAYFLTAMMDGLQFQSKLTADQDMGITVYPVS